MGEPSDSNGKLVEISREEAMVASRMTRSAVRLLTLQEIMVRAPTVWLVYQLVVAGGLTSLTGKHGTCKTFLALAWALCIASGRAWLGRDVIAGPVVYIAAEGAGGLARRIKAWIKVATDIDSEMLGKNFRAIGCAVRLLEDREFESLVEAIRGLAYPPVLIVIDTLARCIPGADENSASDMGVVVDRCAQIQQEFGCAVILVHHSRKSDDDSRGSSALPAAVDTWMVMSKSDGVLQLRCEKQKDAEQFEVINLVLEQIALEQDPGNASAETSCVLRVCDTDNDSREVPEANSAEIGILQTVYELIGEGRVAQSAVFKAGDVPRSTFYRQVERSVKKGMLERVEDDGVELLRLTPAGLRIVVPCPCPVPTESYGTAQASLPQSHSPTSLEGRGTGTEEQAGTLGDWDLYLDPAHD